jgi:hypothetical protein
MGPSQFARIIKSGRKLSYNIINTLAMDHDVVIRLDDQIIQYWLIDVLQVKHAVAVMTADTARFH